MALYETSAAIEAPAEFCYNAWSRIEEFPQYMPAIREVKVLSERRSRWRAVVAGREAEWDAEILAQSPNRYITFKMFRQGKPFGGGTVAFYPLGPKSTRVAVLIEYNPPGGLLGDLVELFGFEKAFRRAVLESLAAFKARTEAQYAAQSPAPAGRVPASAAAPSH